MQNNQYRYNRVETEANTLMASELILHCQDYALFYIMLGGWHTVIKKLSMSGL